MAHNPNGRQSAEHYGFSMQSPGGASPLGQPMWPDRKADVPSEPLGDPGRAALLELADKLEKQASELRRIANG